MSPHPVDNAGLLAIADEIREHEYAAGQAAREAEVATLTRELAIRTDERDTEAQRADAAEQALEDHMATHEPEPPAIRDLVAVRVFPQYSAKVYGRHDAVLNLLGDLGVQRVSGLLTPGMATDVQTFYRRAFDEHGIKVWFTVGEPRVVLTSAQWDKLATLLDGPLNGIVEQLAGWNEPNHRRSDSDPPTTDWEIKTGTHQGNLWNLGNPRGIDVATPQLWSGDLSQHEADLRKLADNIAGKFDTIAWHYYPRGGVGAEAVQTFYDLHRGVLGDHPVCCTEAGYFDAPNYTGGAKVVTPEQAAEFLPQHIRLYTDRGDRFSYFELLNDPDPTGANREAWIGLVKTPSLDPSTWRAKPVFNAVKAMLT